MVDENEQPSWSGNSNMLDKIMKYYLNAIQCKTEQVRYKAPKCNENRLGR